MLSGCGLYSADEARNPFGRHTLIGHSVVDILSCAGIPDSRLQVTPEAGVLQWGFKADGPTFKATVAVLGSVQFGSSSQCKLVVTFMQDGTVTDVAFPGCTGTLFEGPYAEARALVGECIAHPNDVSLPASYDAIQALFPKGK